MGSSLTAAVVAADAAAAAARALRRRSIARVISNAIHAPMLCPNIAYGGFGASSSLRSPPGSKCSIPAAAASASASRAVPYK